jgi:tRNA(Ile)-lysidine synthase
MDAEHIRAALEPYQSAPHIYVAYSGGIDSHVLLHLCVQVPALHAKLCAVHIHHGIQTQADGWLEHCKAAACALGVAFLYRHVDARPRRGDSPEETARNARYRAFAEIVGENEIILSAQHRDDQMETLLLQLFRGAGLAGLASMPKQTACGKGVLLRPLLDVPRAAIQDYAEKHRLQWVEDPSNTAYDYDRNYLRHAVVPLLKHRWPGIGVTVARTARHCAAAQTLLEELAEDLFSTLYDTADRTLHLPSLAKLDRNRQRLLLRHWFKTLGLQMPAETVIERIVTEIVAAPAGRYPALSFRGGAVRRYRDKLYLLPSVRPIDTRQQFEWPSGREALDLPGNGRLLRVVSAAAGIDPACWSGEPITVRYRRGGERLRLPGRAGTHELKDVFQAYGVPPWERETMPLLFIGAKLAVVGGRWINAAFYRSGRDGNVQVVWQLPHHRRAEG